MPAPRAASTPRAALSAADAIRNAIRCRTTPGALPRHACPPAQVIPYGICKVVPPAGWSPQPWSGRPPKGTKECSPLRVSSDSEDALQACSALCGGEGGEVRVIPRLQPLQLFNKAFEPADDLTVKEYRAG